MSKSKRKTERRPRPDETRSLDPRARWIVAALLALLTIVAFAGVRHAGFVQLDDPVYVSENPRVRDGFSAGAVAWAFTTFDNANWHPLTWLSHLADVELFGLDAGLHHVTNLALHTANVVLLFLVLLTLVAPGVVTAGALARCALVAALFGVHPLHVESVAWISERKDVLSTLFWILTMWAYVRYVRAPSAARYAAVVVTFALGLMAKPMLVTLPFVLLLLDVWPLDRVKAPGASLRRLLGEKGPLLALSAVSSAITVVAQERGGAVMSLDVVPFDVRVQNALVSYATYLARAVWPVDLTMFYPQRPPETAAVLVALLVLVTISAAVFLMRRRTLAPAIGWCWYLGTLVPVIGLVQVGRQAMADRYTYVPFIGLFIAVVWAIPRLSRRPAIVRGVVAAAAAAVVVACVVATQAQVRHWRSNAALWTRALSVTLRLTPDRAALIVGGLTDDRGRVDEAMARFFQPDARGARLDAGLALLELGHRDAALDLIRGAIADGPPSSQAHEYLGRALAAAGDAPGAVKELTEAIRLDPANQKAHANLGRLHGDAGRFDQAAAHLTQAVTLAPTDARARCDLGLALTNLGRVDDALAHFDEALKLDPALPELHNNLGLARAAQNRLADAVPHFQEALRLRPAYADALRNLGIAQMRLGRAREAGAAFQDLLRIRPGDPTALQALEILRAGGG